METTVKLFINGRSQAVRIPKAYRFEGVSEVVVRKEGDALILLPARRSWESLVDEAPPVDDDFLCERPDLTGDGNVEF